MKSFEHKETTWHKNAGQPITSHLTGPPEALSKIFTAHALRERK
jgi:hypothetical protein